MSSAKAVCPWQERSQSLRWWDVRRQVKGLGGLAVVLGISEIRSPRFHRFLRIDLVDAFPKEQQHHDPALNIESEDFVLWYL